jgi:hypothetical protein
VDDTDRDLHSGRDDADGRPALAAGRLQADRPFDAYLGTGANRI